MYLMFEYIGICFHVYSCHYQKHARNTIVVSTWKHPQESHLVTGKMEAFIFHRSELFLIYLGFQTSYVLQILPKYNKYDSMEQSSS